MTERKSPLVVVGVDGSDDGLRAVRFGAGTVIRYGGELLLVNAVDDTLMAGAWGVVYDPEVLQSAGATANEQAKDVAIVEADAPTRQALCANVLAEQIPDDAIAPHVFVAAAVQVHLARLATTLDAKALVPVAVGTCPACGGRPASSLVTGAQGIENIRYATCAGCATQWNEVRVKCLCCGSGKGISYRSVDTVDATVKAELCSECHGWIKIFYQNKNPSLDPIADDVGSLGLDILMRDAGYRRGGFNPWLIGY